MSDNFHFDMTGVPLDLALKVAFSQHRHAVAWAEGASNPENRSHEAIWGASAGRRRLVLFWVERKFAHPLPGKMDAEAIESFVRAWLAEADYGQEPDHDGDNGKGVRVYNEAWGHVGYDYGAFVAFEPVWMMYGK